MTSVLVAYASKHGATKAIAERIAEELTVSALDAQAIPVKAVGDIRGYDAFVIGGATYMGSWMKELTEFVHRNGATLATRPVWLFSSGPLGTEPTDAKGRDLLQVSEPKQFTEFKESIKPRAVRVFFGALDPQTLGFTERAIRKLPAGRALLPEGDFRDWEEIEAWARSIALELAPVSTGSS